LRWRWLKSACAFAAAEEVSGRFLDLTLVRFAHGSLISVLARRASHRTGSGLPLTVSSRNGRRTYPGPGTLHLTFLGPGSAPGMTHISDHSLPPDQVRGFAKGRAQGCCSELSVVPSLLRRYPWKRASTPSAHQVFLCLRYGSQIRSGIVVTRTPCMSLWVPDAPARSGKAVGRGEPYISSCPGLRPGIQKRRWPETGWALARRNDGW